MLKLLLLMQLRRQGETTARAELCRALETLQDWIYYPLDRKEYTLLLERLNKIKESADSVLLANLADGMLGVIQQDSRPLTIERPPRFELYIKGFDKWVSEQGLRATLAIGLFAIAIIALKNPASLLITQLGIHGGRWYPAEIDPTAFQARVILEIVVGSLLLVDSLLLFLKKTRIAIPLGFGLLLVYLGILDIFLFYFEQFSTISFVLYQFIVLVTLIYYRTRFSQRESQFVSSF